MVESSGLDLQQPNVELPANSQGVVGRPGIDADDLIRLRELLPMYSSQACTQLRATV
jgi:hypothetical protein